MGWDFRSDLPIYTQLMRQLSERIVSGVYAPGERLPSVRDLAVDAGVNPNTVQRALTDLERQELVFSQRTSGRFVTESAEKIRAEKLRMAEEKTQEFLQAMQQLGCSREEVFSLLRRAAETENHQEEGNA